MDALRASLAGVLAAGLAIAAAAHAQDPAPPEQIMWSADSWTRTGDTYTIRGLTIEGADLRIEADRAVTTSLEFSGSWELEGSIRMRVGTGRLLASSARFEFESGELVAGELEGDPATFEETEPEGSGPVRGEASRIVFDREGGTVQMQGSASFTMAQNSMSGCDFVYELDGGLVSGSSECGVPLSIIYVPPSATDGSETTSDGGDASSDPGSNGTSQAP